MTNEQLLCGRGRVHACDGETGWSSSMSLPLGPHSNRSARHRCSLVLILIAATPILCCQWKNMRQPSTANHNFVRYLNCSGHGGLSNGLAAEKYQTFDHDFGDLTMFACHSKPWLFPPSFMYWSNKPFHLKNLTVLKNSSEHAGLNIITMEQYLKLTEILKSNDPHPSDNNRN